MGKYINIADKDIKGWLAKARKATDNPATYLTPIGALIKESTRLRFVDGKGPDGAKWKAVKRDHGTGVPLRKTSMHLMNTINYEVQGKSVVIGVAYSWAAIHQKGGTITFKRRKGSVTIAARPFFGINAEDKEGIRGILERAYAPDGKTVTA